MEFVQDQITTLHDFTDPVPAAPLDRSAVVVPVTEREHDSLAADRVFRRLEGVEPRSVIVALRADDDDVGPVSAWLESYDLPLTILWCGGPRLAERLADKGLDGPGGKGRDVWLALGVAAAEHDYVAVHDADASSYSRADVPRLLFPLGHGYTFSKGYYARVEAGRLYGRMFRLFLVPLLSALRETRDAPVLDYLAAFRYGLAGEFAATSAVIERLRPPRGWGLEIATLGDAFRTAGFEGTAQVDLGVHEHDHRSVGGPDGLSHMAVEVAESLFAVLREHGVRPDFETLPGRYQTAANRLVSQYEADAEFNGLTYEADAEREQIRTYAGAIKSGDDVRLPAWSATALEPADVRETAERDLAENSG